MTDATSTTATAVGMTTIKLAVLTGIAALLASIIVMALTLPNTVREWAASLTATVAGSVFGGAFLVQHYGLAEWLNQGYVGIAAICGFIFVAGLPAWVLVRAFFNYMNKDRSIIDVIKAIRAAWKD